MDFPVSNTRVPDEFIEELWSLIFWRNHLADKSRQTAKDIQGILGHLWPPKFRDPRFPK
jgi:hypothetical protein